VDWTEARDTFAAARVARLATVRADGRPHLVPIVFAMPDDDTVVFAVDAKPKRTTALKRLANIAAHPAVAVLADAYSEDWRALWWVRGDGIARVIDPGDDDDLRARALDALAARYEQYRDARPAGAVVTIAIERWSGWRGR
jgi:PPOX class probable F420-dependent enzyme